MYDFQTAHLKRAEANLRAKLARINGHMQRGEHIEAVVTAQYAIESALRTMAAYLDYEDENENAPVAAGAQ